MYYDDVQIRLIILYALSKLKISASEDRLQELLVWSNILDYFTMMDFLLDMQNLGMITTVLIEDKTCYDITVKGSETVTMFEDKIPMSIRERIYDGAMQILDNISRGREIVTDIVPIDMKKYLAKCGIYERGTPLLEINLFAGSRKSAQEIQERFKKGAGELYRIILEKIVE